MQEEVVNKFNELASGFRRKEIKFAKGYKEYEDAYTSYLKYDWFKELIERIEIKQR